MLKDDEVALMSTARAPGLRVHNRADRIAEVCRDFLGGTRFDGQRLLELGPGHYEFCEFARALGAEVAAIDCDPAVSELGRKRGFTVFEGDLRNLSSIPVDVPYDGLFCRGSVNPFWSYPDRAALREHVRSLTALITPAGWGWVVACPWLNDRGADAEYREWLEFEREVYTGLGWRSWQIRSRVVASYYGINFVPPALSVFTRNTPKYRRPPNLPIESVRFVLGKLGRKLRGLMQG